MHLDSVSIETKDEDGVKTLTKQLDLNLVAHLKKRKFIFDQNNDIDI